jgi:hypothetical protein
MDATTPRSMPRACLFSVLFVSFVLWWQHFELLVVDQQRRTIAHKQDIVQVTCAKNLLDSANASSGQPMHALGSADVIADLKLGWWLHTVPVSERLATRALVRGVHTPARAAKVGAWRV